MNRGGKIVLWVVGGTITLVLLFYLFEFVVPRLLPANF
jgi:hypothetical protein